MTEAKPVMWHKLSFGQFAKYELNRPQFRPFVIGAGVAFLLAGVLPTLSATDEERAQSKYLQKCDVLKGKSNH